MPTLSVQLNPKLEKFVNSMVESGYAKTKSEVVVKALKLLEEEDAIASVLKSEQEFREGKTFRGDLRELVKKFK